MSGEIERAVTLVMFQPPTPARESTTWKHVPSQPSDATTAFAVPNPGYPSQSCRFFQVRSPRGSPRMVDHSVYFGLAQYYCANPFDRRRSQSYQSNVKSQRKVLVQ
jgi:hypothetical protein